MRLVNCLAPLVLATSLHAGLTEWQAAVSADNPRNWYRFDETTGTALVDHGTGGLSGEYVGVTINQAGLFGPGQAANFPGQPTGNDLVRFDTNTWASMTITQDWTAEFIIYKTAENWSQALFNGPNTSVRLEQWGSFDTYGDYRGGVTQYGVLDYYLEGTVANVNEWSHMVFVRSGGQTFIYLNGVHRGSMDAVVNLELQTISRSSTTEWDKLHAMLDEAIVYDRALTSAQVANHFAATGIIPPVIAPTITGQPQSQSVIIGTPNATVTLSVVASGTLPLDYQWRLNGVDIEGATSETLTLTDVTSANAGTYSVVVSNSGGSETSADATFAIVAPPFNEGDNQTVLSGFPATLSVTLPDVEGYVFEWVKDGTIIPDETGPSLSIDSAATSDTGVYELIIAIGGETATAGPSQFIVPAVPTTSYADSVLGDNPLAYWRLGDATGAIEMTTEVGSIFGDYFSEVDNEQPGALLGDANSSAAFRGTVESKAEVYPDNDLSTSTFTVELWAKRTGGAGTFTSPITFRDSNSAAVPPYIRGWVLYATSANNWQFRIADGSDTWVTINGPAVADGDWTQLVGTYDGTAMAFYVNGALVESRDAGYAPVDPMLLYPVVRVAGGQTEDIDGSFFFIGQLDEIAVYGRALNASEIADHYAAAFSPDVPPVIAQQPQSAEIVNGGTATFSVQVLTGTVATYQWKKDGTAIEGETGTSLTVANANGQSAGAYTVDVTNAAGTVGSDPATLTVVGPEETYQATVLRDGPVAYWRLDDTTGTVAVDSVGGHDGTYVNGVVLGEPGALANDDNTAARFIQANSTSVEVPWSADLNTPEFTFELWAKVTGGTSYRSPMTSRADPPQAGYIFYATPGNAWQYWTGPGWSTLGGATVQNDAWVHLVGTFDGTTKRFFVNGQQVGSSQPAAVNPNPTSILRIGGGATESPTGSFFFEGVIDEAAVYNKALSPARILTHYQAGRPASPSIAIAIEGGQVVISWEGAATLQEASIVDGGAWSDVEGATSPHPVTPSETQKFWRLMSP